MPFPALSLPVSIAIGVPIGLAGFAAQETILRRRAARRKADASTAEPIPSPPTPAPKPAVTASPAPAPALPRTAAGRGTTAVRPAAAQRKRAEKQPSPASPARAAARRQAVPSTATLRKHETALERALEAVIAFVDAPPRRAAAAACADSLLLAVPAKLRGPALSAFLHGAGEKQAPGKLQELAEDVGVELATALRQVKADLRARSES